jgi:CopG family nickel-responsive transcriptional regulator
MERFTVSIDDALAQAFNGWLRERGYANRSEGFRDLLRAELERHRQATGRSRYCVASLSYVYNHHERDLAGRLAALQHAHHPLVITSTHVHLDHEQCLEMLMLRGPTTEVQAFSDALCAHRGVRHAAINVVSVQLTTGRQRHGHVRGHSHGNTAGVPHVHMTPSD